MHQSDDAENEKDQSHNNQQFLHARNLSHLVNRASGRHRLRLPGSASFACSKTKTPARRGAGAELAFAARFITNEPRLRPSSPLSPQWRPCDAAWSWEEWRALLR